MRWTRSHGYVASIGLTLISLLGMGIPILFFASSYQVEEQVTKARRQAQDAVEQVLQYQRAFARDPGSITRLNAEFPTAEIVETDPWGRPWVLSPAFQDTRTPLAPGDLWVCSPGPAGTGPCPPADIRRYASPLEGSIGYSQQFGGWSGSERWWVRPFFKLISALGVLAALSLPIYTVGHLLYRIIARVVLGKGRRRPSPMLDGLFRGALIGTVIVFVFVFVFFVVPNILSAGRKSRASRAASDTKTAVTQAIVYWNDKGVYPTSLKVLRESGYLNLPDNDPWGTPYVLSPLLRQGSTPKESDDIYIYSKGKLGIGRYPRPLTETTGEGGSIGYSSLYGAWSGN
jgi:hypothetical protein